MFVQTNNAAEAYRQAFDVETWKPTSIWVEACKLKSKPKVAQRINELLQIRRSEHDVTFATLVRELDEAIKLAHDTEKAAAAVSGIMAKAKLMGMVVEQHTHESPKGTMTPRAAVDADAMAALLEKLTG